MAKNLKLKDISQILGQSFAALRSGGRAAWRRTHDEVSRSLVYSCLPDGVVTFQEANRAREITEQRDSAEVNRPTGKAQEAAPEQPKEKAEKWHFYAKNSQKTIQNVLFPAFFAL